MAIPAEYRFIEKFVLGPNSCWLWTANTRRNGYGLFQVTAGTSIGAHRFAYELLVGPIPEGMHLDHLCRVRNCINPDHLEPVTPAENQRRGLRGVLYTHCAKGHEMTAENTLSYETKRGSERKCRSCQRAHNQKYWQRTRGAKY